MNWRSDSVTSAARQRRAASNRAAPVACSKVTGSARGSSGSDALAPQKLGFVAGAGVLYVGLGDQSGYSDNFCDAMDELASTFKKQGATIVGATSTDGYDFEESKSVAGGKFVGLPCDEDNQPDMSEERVKAWVAQIKGEGMPL